MVQSHYSILPHDTLYHCWSSNDTLWETDDWCTGLRLYTSFSCPVNRHVGTDSTRSLTQQIDSYSTQLTLHTAKINVYLSIQYTSNALPVSSSGTNGSARKSGAALAVFVMSKGQYTWMRALAFSKFHVILCWCYIIGPGISWSDN